MRVRLIVALIALAALTAFAPAPLPKTSRRTDPNLLTVANFQGDWTAVSFDYVGAGDQLSPIGLWFQGVRIRGDHWIYLVNGSESSTYRITIDNNTRPAAIDYYEVQGKPEKPGMFGIVKRQGSRVTILYYGYGPARPK